MRRGLRIGIGIIGCGAILAGGYGAYLYTRTSDLRKFRAIVANSLKDPASAQFRNEKVLKESAGKFYCGQLNAKNGYGGYTGFVTFVADEHSVRLQPQDESNTLDSLKARLEFFTFLRDHCFTAAEKAAANAS